MVANLQITNPNINPTTPSNPAKLTPSTSFDIQEILDCSERNVFEAFDVNINQEDDLEWLVKILVKERRWEELGALFGSMDVYSTSLLERLLQKAVEGGASWNVIFALLCVKRTVSESRDDESRTKPASILRQYFLPSTIPSSNRVTKKSLKSILVLLQICLTGWKNQSNHGSLNAAISFLLENNEKDDRYKTFHPDEIENDIKHFFLTLFDEIVEQHDYSSLNIDPYVLSSDTSSIQTNVNQDIVLFYPNDTTTMGLIDQFEVVLINHTISYESNVKIFLIEPNQKVSPKEDLELITKCEEAEIIHYEVHIYPDVSYNHIPKIEPLCWENIMKLCQERQFGELSHLFGFSIRYNLLEKKLKALFRHLVDSDVPHGIIWSLLQLRNDHHFMDFYKISTYAPFCLLRSYFIGVLSSNKSTLASLITLKLFLLSFYTRISQDRDESLKQPDKVLEALYFILFSNYDSSTRYSINSSQPFTTFESFQFLNEMDRYATIEDDISNIIQSIDRVLKPFDYDDLLYKERKVVVEESEGDCVNGTCGMFQFTCYESTSSFCTNIYTMFQINIEQPRQFKVIEFLQGIEYDTIFTKCPMLNTTHNEFIHKFYSSSFYQHLIQIIDFFRLDTDLPLDLDETPDKKLRLKENDIQWESVFRDSVQILGKSLCHCTTNQRIKDGTTTTELLKSNYPFNNHFQCMPSASSWDYHDLDNALMTQKDRFIGCSPNLADVFVDASCQTLPELSEETLLGLQREKENISAVIDILSDSLRIIEVKKSSNLKKKEEKEPGMEMVLVQTSPDSPLLNAIDTVPLSKEHCIVSMNESDENKIIYNFLTLPEETRDTILKEIEEEMLLTPNQVSWTEGANVVSACISAAVNLLEQLLSNRVSAVQTEIEIAGNMAKENIKSPMIIPINEQNAKTVLTYTGETKRLTQKLKDKSKGIYTGLRDTSATALVGIGKKLGEAEVGKTIIPHQESLEILSAAGSVALSGLGAASIVYEMMLSTTEKVAKKTNAVAADVVRHKYGNEAGQVVEDIGEASYNTFRTLKFVSLINQVDMSIAVARNTGKEAKYNTPQSLQPSPVDMYHSTSLRKRSRSVGNYIYSQQKHYDDDASFNQSVYSESSKPKYDVVQAEVLCNENLNINNSTNAIRHVRRRSGNQYTKTIAKNLPLKGHVKHNSASMDSIALTAIHHQKSHVKHMPKSVNSISLSAIHHQKLRGQ